MSESLNCPTCGREIEAGMLRCPHCNARIIDTGRFEADLPDIGKVGVKFPDMPDLDLPPTPESAVQQQADLPDLMSKLFPVLSVDLSESQIKLGKAYDSLLVIGPQDDGDSLLDMPFGLGLLPGGDLYIIDFVDQDGTTRVQRFDPAGVLVDELCCLPAGDDTAAVKTPAGIAVDMDENVYIVDMGLNCIKKLGPDGDVLATLGHEGTANDALMAPQAIALDAAGTIYIADTDNNRVLKWGSSGQPWLVLGINELDEDAGWLMAGEEPGEFDEPKSVAVGVDGRIYVADGNNHRIQVFAADGSLAFVFGEEGDSEGEFQFPSVVRVDSGGLIYVVDQNGDRLQKFTPDGHFIYQFYLPEDAGGMADVVVDDQGDLFAALRHKQAVLKLRVL